MPSITLKNCTKKEMLREMTLQRSYSLAHAFDFFSDYTYLT